MVLSLLLGMAMAAASECKATTDVKEFEAQIQRACGEHIQAVSFTGNHDSATFVITFAVNLSGQQIAQTFLAQQAWRAAVTSHTVLQRAYPMKRFQYSIKDSNGEDVCDFIFSDEEEKPFSAKCMSYVR